MDPRKTFWKDGRRSNLTHGIFFLPPVGKKNTQSFLLVEGEKKNHPARSAVDRQSRLSAKCKHIAEKDLLYPAPKVPLASVLISLKQLAFLQSDFSPTTALFFPAVFKDIPELPVLLPVEAK